MKWLYASTAALCLIAFRAESALEIQGKVVDESGDPIAAATVDINGTATASESDGSFALSLSSDSELVIQIQHEGYFDALQVFSASDSADNILTIPRIRLVERKQGRRLLLFAGDAMMGRRYLEPRASERVLVTDENRFEDMQNILRHVRPFIQQADFASVNLEIQLAAEPIEDALAKSVVFLAHPDFAKALEWAGFDYVALGNNHMYDFGEAGLASTLDALEDTGLSWSGAGFSDAEARQSAIVDLDGQKLELLSYVGWPGRFTPNQVAAEDKGGAALGTEIAIREDLAGAGDDNLKIVQYHSGLEYVDRPPLAEETRLKLALDNGAALAVGHHAHVTQGLEIYNDRLIAYSLGNFVFDQYLPATQVSMLLYAWFDGSEFHAAEVVPIDINGYKPTPATGSMRYLALQRIAALSRSETTCVAPTGGHLSVQRCDIGDQTAEARDLSVNEPINTPVHLLELGIGPVERSVTISAGRPFRTGIDLLRRGSFDYAGRYDIPDRFWLTGREAQIVDGGSPALEVLLENESTVRTGMKVLTRVFERSSPGAVAGTVVSDGCARLEFFMQRRPDGMSFTDALSSGPIESIGSLELQAGEAGLNVPFNFPRTFTRSVRLLVDVTRCDGTDKTVRVAFESLAMIQWQTPWLADGSPLPPVRSTHIQFQN